MARPTLLPVLLLTSLGFVEPPSVEAVPLLTVGSATVGVGDLVTIPVSITEATDLTFWQFDLMFDPVVVQGTTITEGPFLSAFGTSLFGAGVIDNGTGLISIVTGAYVDVPPNPSGDGVLAEIQFLAIFPGVSPLALSNVFLNLSGEGSEIASGQITVTGVGPPEIPEPTTLALIAGGLVLLGRRRLARQWSNRQRQWEAGS
jgi:hypothetical protein